MSELRFQLYSVFVSCITGMVFIKTVVKIVQIDNVDMVLFMVEGRFNALFLF